MIAMLWDNCWFLLCILNYQCFKTSNVFGGIEDAVVPLLST
jgi:hypothetical protein